jgi:hypothetical protein
MCRRGGHAALMPGAGLQLEKASTYKPTRFTHGTMISSENQGENPAFLHIIQNGGTTITGENMNIIMNISK